MYGNAKDVLKENSGIVDELLNDEDNDPRHHFLIRKQSKLYHI